MIIIILLSSKASATVNNSDYRCYTILSAQPYTVHTFHTDFITQIHLYHLKRLI